MVVVCDNITSVPSGHPVMFQRLGYPLHDYDEVEKDMVATGFHVVLQQDMEIRRDLSEPSDGIVKFIQMISGRCESEVRDVIDDVFSQPSMHVSLRKLAIFTKAI